MPLKSGSSKKVIGKNISELVETFKKKGKIGDSKPKSKKAAVKQAAAVAYAKAGKTKVKESFDTYVNRVLNEVFGKGDVYDINDPAQDFNKAQSTLIHLGMDHEAIDENEFNQKLKSQPFSKVIEYVQSKKKPVGSSPLPQPAGQQPQPSQTIDAQPSNNQTTQLKSPV